MATENTSTSVLSLLLAADTEKLRKPRKEVEIKRLSEALGTKVVFILEAIDGRKMDEIQESAMTIKGQDVDIDIAEMQALTVLEGVKEPSFKNKEFREKYNAASPKELLSKVLLSGEIAKLYNVIQELSGFGENAVEEVKN